MCAGLHVGQRARQIQPAVKTGDMATDVVGERRLRQLLLEGVVFLAVEAVVQMIALPAALQLVQMSHKRRDADAAGDQHVMLRLRRQREQVIGVLMVSVSPIASRSCMKSEPPLEGDSRRTAIW